MALLDTATLDGIRETWVDGLENISVGGASWQAETISGNGASAAATASLGTAYAGYTYQRQQTRESRAGAGPYPDSTWVHVVTAASPPTLTIGQVIQGTGYRFRIVGPIPDPLYPTYACDLVAK